MPIAADLADPASLARGLETLGDAPLDALIYAAAADRGDDGAYRAAYVDGLRNAIAALVRRGQALRRILFTSSTAVYAQRGGEWVDEASATEPTQFRGTRMLEAEGALFASGIPATALRLGGIYGPGRTRLVERVRSGRASISPGTPRYTNRIHRDDAAGALRHLVARSLAGESIAPIYLGVDDDPAEEALVLRWLAAELGAPEPSVSEPADETTAPDSNKRCRNARLRAAGYRFRYPTFREGYAALLT